VHRVDGYAPIRDYAALGDGRTVALVARDGAVDWLALPDLDSPPVFATILDAERGGSFALRPEDEFEAMRRYLPRTNVLETTFQTETGVATVTDALALQDGGQLSWVELVRRVRGVRGRVRFRFELRPRFDYTGEPTSIEHRRGVHIAHFDREALVLRAWGADETTFSRDTIAGRLETRRGSKALLVCIGMVGDPIPLPPRHEIERRFEQTCSSWKRWLDFHDYDGPWEDAVERSTLALKLLIYATSGAIAAAPTTSLPERIGGGRNFDYRYAWIRDSAFVLDALGELGYREQVHASLCWLLDATESTHPRLAPFYKLNRSAPEAGGNELPLAGYRGSRPVLQGNDAARQLQLGSYGDLLETIELYVRHGNTLDERTRVRLAETADHVCRIWRNEDSSIWELPTVRHYTISKINCWVALDRALQLVAAGEAPAEHADRWREEAEAIRRWVDQHCWSDARRSYAFFAGSDELDAALLLAARAGYVSGDDPRAHSTIDAIRSGLGAGGPLLYRYSGQERVEGAFLACSFWLVEALARCGRVDEARETMDELLALANDVGLYSEEIDPESHELLGNFPQGLTHLALINAANAVAAAERDEEGDDDEQA
jgi:GH15 family glucan-1,4-alpha-glucosidase